VPQRCLLAQWEVSRKKWIVSPAPLVARRRRSLASNSTKRARILSPDTPCPPITPPPPIIACGQRRTGRGEVGGAEALEGGFGDAMLRGDLADGSGEEGEADGFAVRVGADGAGGLAAWGGVR